MERTATLVRLSSISVLVCLGWFGFKAMLMVGMSALVLLPIGAEQDWC